MCRSLVLFSYWLLLSIAFSIPLSAQTLQNNALHAISPIGRGDLKCADVDNDGNVDVVISGINDLGDRFSAVYRNNADGTFTNFGVGLPALSDGGIAMGDINNDGLVDIFTTGVNNTSGKESKLFLNQGGGALGGIRQAAERSPDGARSCPAVGQSKPGRNAPSRDRRCQKHREAVTFRLH